MNKTTIEMEKYKVLQKINNERYENVMICKNTSGGYFNILYADIQP